MSQPSSIRAKLCLAILGCLFVYLIGNGSVALWDRDEPRYAQTSRQMLQSGDYVVPKFLDTVRTAKPIFIYWCQALSMRIFGDTDAAARLPSAIAMAIILLILAAVLYKAAGPQHALWTVFIFGTSALTIAAAKMSITDAVLLVWILIAQLCFYGIWRGHHGWKIVLTMWLAVGVAGLTKGPVVLAVMFMTALVLAILDAIDQRSANKIAAADDDTIELEASPTIPYHRPRQPEISTTRAFFRSFAWLKRTRPIVGLLVVAAVVAPWLIGIEMGSPGFLRQTLMHDVWKRAVTPLEQHKGPPGYYLLTIWGTYLPWCLLLPAAVMCGWKHHRSPQIRFAMAAMIGPWVLMELVQTKLPHYLLPAFPPLAFLTADFLIRAMRGMRVLPPLPSGEGWGEGVSVVSTREETERPLTPALSQRERGQDDADEARAVSDRAFFIGLAAWCVAIVLIGAAPWLAGLKFPFLPVNAMAALLAATIVLAIGVWIRFRARDVAAAAGLMGVGMLAVVTLAYTWYLPRADFLRLSPRVAKILIDNHITGDGQVVMMDYMEPSLAFYQGGTIREDPRKIIAPEDLPTLPRFMVITDKMWADSPAVHDRLEVIGSARGLAYANRGRVMNVMVVRKK